MGRMARIASRIARRTQLEKALFRKGLVGDDPPSRIKTYLPDNNFVQDK